MADSRAKIEIVLPNKEEEALEELGKKLDNIWEDADLLIRNNVFVIELGTELGRLDILMAVSYMYNEAGKNFTDKMLGISAPTNKGGATYLDLYENPFTKAGELIQYTEQEPTQKEAAIYMEEDGLKYCIHWHVAKNRHEALLLGFSNRILNIVEIPANIPNTEIPVTGIGYSAFGCFVPITKNVVEVNFSSAKNLEQIEEKAFQSLRIPAVDLCGCDKLKMVFSKAFSNNSDLSKVDFSKCSKLCYLEADTFKNTSMTGINDNKTHN